MLQLISVVEPKIEVITKEDEIQFMTSEVVIDKKSYAELNILKEK